MGSPFAVLCGPKLGSRFVIWCNGGLSNWSISRVGSHCTKTTSSLMRDCDRISTPQSGRDK